VVGLSSRALATIPALAAEPRRRTLGGALAAFGTRRLVRFAAWRARRESRKTAVRPSDQVFRGFVQINLIRPR
jgi:hypothetical protein